MPILSSSQSARAVSIYLAAIAPCPQIPVLTYSRRVLVSSRGHLPPTLSSWNFNLDVPSTMYSNILRVFLFLSFSLSFHFLYFSLSLRCRYLFLFVSFSLSLSLSLSLSFFFSLSFSLSVSLSQSPFFLSLSFSLSLSFFFSFSLSVSLCQMATSTVTYTYVSSKNCIQARIHSANIVPHIKVYFSETLSCATWGMSRSRRLASNFPRNKNKTAQGWTIRPPTSPLSTFYYVQVVNLVLLRLLSPYIFV